MGGNSRVIQIIYKRLHSIQFFNQLVFKPILMDLIIISHRWTQNPLISVHFILLEKIFKITVKEERKREDEYKEVILIL
jgi:hypothetical protein